MRKTKTKSQIGKASKRKGAAAERQASKLLSEAGYPSRRGCQFSGGKDSPDIVCADLKDVFHFEVKHVEKLNLLEAYKQACEDSKGLSVPVVMHKKNSTPWMITMSFEHWKEMLRSYVPISEELL